jgi:type I restriction enzyme S subunit
MGGDVDELPLAETLPAIPEGWRYESLGDLVDERGVSYGIVQPGSATTGGVPIVRVNNIRDGRIDTSDVLKVAPEIEAKFKRSRLRGGEVLLTLVGTLGEVAVVPLNIKGWNVARAVGVIPVREDPGSAWVSICLRSAFVQHCIRTWATSTVQATFNLRDLAKLPIAIPPKKTREAIAAVLGALDDKIELNRRMNATLEAMARALFQSWFVDFDPVRAKQEGRPPAGLDEVTAALFADQFEESELGRIPQGWDVAKLDELASIRGGKQLPTEECLADAEFPVFGANGIMGYASQPTHKGFVIAFGRVGAYCGSIHWSLDGAWINNNASSVVPNMWPEYVLQVMLGIDFHSMRSGSAQPFIPNSALAAAKLLRPPEAVALQYCRFVAPLRRKQAESEKQSQTLASLRDTLLPRLLSGGLRCEAANLSEDCS